MGVSSSCGKCGSDAIIPGVRLADRGHLDVEQESRLTVARTPDKLFKNRVAATVRAAVCGACGFVELYADNPEALLAAHLEAVRRREHE